MQDIPSVYLLIVLETVTSLTRSLAARDCYESYMYRNPLPTIHLAVEGRCGCHIHTVGPACEGAMVGGFRYHIRWLIFAFPLSQTPIVI